MIKGNLGHAKAVKQRIANLEINLASHIRINGYLPKQKFEGIGEKSIKILEEIFNHSPEETIKIFESERNDKVETPAISKNSSRRQKRVREEDPNRENSARNYEDQ